jgi:dihydroorotase
LTFFIRNVAAYVKSVSTQVLIIKQRRTQNAVVSGTSASNPHNQPWKHTLHHKDHAYEGSKTAYCWPLHFDQHGKEKKLTRYMSGSRNGSGWYSIGTAPMEQIWRIKANSWQGKHT